MENREKLIDVLEHIKSAILEVQSNFSEAAELFNRKQDYDIAEMPSGKNNVYCVNQKEEETLTEYDKFIKDGNYLKDIITESQARFLYAVRIINNRQTSNLTEEQVIKIQQLVNQATIDIVSYSDLLRRLYEAINIPRFDYESD